MLQYTFGLHSQFFFFLTRKKNLELLEFRIFFYINTIMKQTNRTQFLPSFLCVTEDLSIQSVRLLAGIAIISKPRTGTVFHF